MGGMRTTPFGDATHAVPLSQRPEPNSRDPRNSTLALAARFRRGLYATTHGTTAWMRGRMIHGATPAAAAAQVPVLPVAILSGAPGRCCATVNDFRARVPSPSPLGGRCFRQPAHSHRTSSRQWRLCATRPACTSSRDAANRTPCLAENRRPTRRNEVTKTGCARTHYLDLSPP